MRSARDFFHSEGRPMLFLCLFPSILKEKNKNDNEGAYRCLYGKLHPQTLGFYRIYKVRLFFVYSPFILCLFAWCFRPNPTQRAHLKEYPVQKQKETTKTT